jgi:hypothetical protein
MQNKNKNWSHIPYILGKKIAKFNTSKDSKVFCPYLDFSGFLVGVLLDPQLMQNMEKNIGPMVEKVRASR